MSVVVSRLETGAVRSACRAQWSIGILPMDDRLEPRVSCAFCFVFLSERRTPNYQPQGANPMPLGDNDYRRLLSVWEKAVRTIRLSKNFGGCLDQVGQFDFDTSGNTELF